MHKSIFVSSTFRDFQTERDLIQNQVEIKVNEGLRDLHVSFVDLRWGIDTTNETGLNKVVAICIEEVLASYPYYIIMLGGERLIIFDDETVLVSKDGVYKKYILVDHPLNLIGNEFVWR